MLSSERHRREKRHRFYASLRRCVGSGREALAWTLALYFFVIVHKNNDQTYPKYRTIDSHERVWHGGYPVKKGKYQHDGSCWCGQDSYCMCTPSLAIDSILVEEGKPDHVWLVKRRDTGQYATVGGFVEVGKQISFCNALKTCEVEMIVIANLFALLYQMSLRKTR